MVQCKKSLFWLKRLLLNFYCISTLSFMLWMLFFDYQNLFVQYKLYKKLQKVKADQFYYHAHIQQIERQNVQLLHDNDYLERFAREKYFMKKPKEDLYVIIPE